MNGEFLTSSSTDRRAWLAAAAVITLAYYPLPNAVAELTWSKLPIERTPTSALLLWYVAVELTLALALAVSTPRASGLTLGRVPRNWRLVLAVAVVVLSTLAVIYPQLDQSRRPFAGVSAIDMTTSAAAQELVFTGFLYGRFKSFYSEPIWRRLDIPWAVVVTAAYFSLSHVWNVASLSPHFVVFQLAYTFVGGIGHALLRHWTGSVIWPILVHMTVNWIAVQN